MNLALLSLGRRQPPHFKSTHGSSPVVGCCHLTRFFLPLIWELRSLRFCRVHVHCSTHQSNRSANALAATLRINTVMRGLSLARNLLTPTSAEAFGLLLAGGYEVLAPELDKRAAAEEAIAAQNKIAQDAMKKKKDARVETRLPLSAVVVQNGADGISTAVAGRNRSLAALNLAENRALGADGALLVLLSKLTKARKEEAEEGSGKAGAAVLQVLNLARCQGYDEQESGEGEDLALGEQAGAIAAMVFALKPTKVIV